MSVESVDRVTGSGPMSRVSDSVYNNPAVTGFWGGVADPELVTDGLVMWLDASDTSTMTLTSTRVDEWRDKLGSGNKVQTVAALGTSFNPTRNSALFDGRGGVVFTAAGKYMESDASFPLNATDGWTVLMAIKRTNRNGFWMTTDYNRAPMSSIYFGERLGAPPGALTRYGAPRNISYIQGTIKTGSTLRVVRNGLSLALDSGSVTTSPSGAFNKIQLGGWQGNAGPAAFDLAGAFYWNRVLSDSELMESYSWIKNYYGVGDIPEPTWNIVAHGNSHVIGTGGTNVSTMNEGILAANGAPLATDWLAMGTGGIATTALASEAAAKIDPLYDTNISANKRILIFWEGTNHIATTVSSDASVFYNAIKSYCEARKLVGWKIIVGTILPRGGTMANSANYEAVRTAVNQSIRDAFAAEETWLDAIADVGADTTIGESGDSANTTYYNTDQIHLKDAGQTIAATYFRDAINAVTGL